MTAIALALVFGGCDCSTSGGGHRDGGGDDTDTGVNDVDTGVNGGDGGDGDGGNGGDSGNGSDAGNGTDGGGGMTDGGPTCLTAATACPGKCGLISNNCAGIINCSDAAGVAAGGMDCSTAGGTCTGAGNTCVAAGADAGTCMPYTCATLGHTCGTFSNGCGGMLNCWPMGTSACTGGTQCLSTNGSSNGPRACVTPPTSCTGNLCNSVPTCAMNSQTTLTGTVITPGRGGFNKLPVPNAVIYVPGDTNLATVLPAIPDGITVGNAASCQRCADEALVAPGQTILAGAVSDSLGHYSLSGRLPIGVPFNVVVKVGRWRTVRSVTIPMAQKCTTQAGSAAMTTLASSTADGLTGTHLPKIALSTGDADAMECVLFNMGILDSEFVVPSVGTPNPSGRIHLYSGDANDGFQKGGNTYSEANLYQTPATLNGYDLTILDCQGTENTAYAASEANFTTYVENGGRLFASHWAYNVITSDTTTSAARPHSWDESAAWNGSTSTSVTTGTGFISMPTTYAYNMRAQANATKSPLFRDWLQNLSALTNPTTAPQFTITDPRFLAGATSGPATDEWVYRVSGGGTTSVQQLSFNTPYQAAPANICGRVTYSAFHVATATAGQTTLAGFCGNARALNAQELILAFMLFDISSCVSVGGGPSICVPETAANVCPNVNDACGYIDDGCGGVIDCAGCGSGYYCDGPTNTCVMQPPPCVPKTCMQLNASYVCGQFPDGCGGIADGAMTDTCGSCMSPSVCGPAGTCVASCTPNANPCGLSNCGSVFNGCTTVYCGPYTMGTCGPGDTCVTAGGVSTCQFIIP